MSVLRFNLNKTLKWSIPATIAYIVCNVILFAYDLWLFNFYTRVEEQSISRANLIAEGERIDAVGAAVSYGAIAIMILVFLVNSTWIYRASWNARELQPDSDRITPGWSIGWYLVPIMNFWKPFQAILQTWNSSENPTLSVNRPAPVIFLLWWGAWVISSILSKASFRITMRAEDLAEYQLANHIDIVNFFVSVPAAILFIVIMRRVTKMQAARMNDLPYVPAEGSSP